MHEFAESLESLHGGPHVSVCGNGFGGPRCLISLGEVLWIYNSIYLRVKSFYFFRQEYWILLHLILYSCFTTVRQIACGQWLRMKWLKLSLILRLGQLRRHLKHWKRQEISGMISSGDSWFSILTSRVVTFKTFITSHNLYSYIFPVLWTLGSTIYPELGERK